MSHRLPFFWGDGLQIQNSEIQTSNIVFGEGYTATQLADPVNPLDVANKEYIDAKFASVKANVVETVTLSGVGQGNATVLQTLPSRGIFTILVTSTVEDGPVARFSGYAASATRGDHGLEGQSGGAGNVSGFVRLQLYKDATSGNYYLYKTCDASGDEDTWDGTYQVLSTTSAS